MQGLEEGGSSPLTRGKPKWAVGPSCVPGLIPAHAGKTSTASARPPKSGAHPRSRGENLDSSACTATVPGSSPLTRGKRGLINPPLDHVGLIPAHAGKTD